MCPAQFTFLSETGQCYLVSQKQAFTWSEADQECKTRGASLIALQTEERYKIIKNWYADSKYTAIMSVECRAVFDWCTINGVDGCNSGI